MSAIPRDAASVILLRRAFEGGGAQALLIRRHASLAFAGGTWVFPGGKLEPADGAPETLARAVRASRGHAAADLGLMVAACRETFEEAGVVLACHPQGGVCEAALADRLQPFRADVSKDAALFPALLAEHGLAIDPARLIPWSHWITPSLAAKRFDTRFFVAAMPPGQAVRCDSPEATELKWLDLAMPGGLPPESLIHAPPTRYSLGDVAQSLARHGSVERLIESEAGRPVVPMMPKMLRIDGRMTAIMPWDPEYHALPGEGVAPGVPIPPPYLNFPSRVTPPRGISGMPD